MSADFQDLYCRWAENHYGLSNVTRVDFEPRYVEGCPTCGGDNYIEVEVWHGDGGYSTFEEDYATKLINSILAEALDA